MRAGAASADPSGAQSVDLSWTRRLTGTYKAVYDSPDIGGGLGVLRAGIVSAQYMAAFNVPASAVTGIASAGTNSRLPSLAALAMRATVRDMLRAPWYHPTLAEIITYPLEEIVERLDR